MIKCLEKNLVAGKDKKKLILTETSKNFRKNWSQCYKTENKVKLVEK